MKSPNEISHILLVDDDRDDCELFGEALHEFAPHIKLSCLTDNSELLSFIDKINPELIFLDVNMPRKNGYECLDEIKQSQNCNSIPVIMYSITGRTEDVDNAYKIGAALFLRKPPSYSSLVESLKEIVQKEWSKPAVVTAQYFSNGRYYPFG